MNIDQNFDILKKKYSYVEWDKLLQLENTSENSADIEASRKGLDTIKVCIDGNVAYLHSKYDPLSEARTIVGSLELNPEVHHLLFYGIGLGYTLDVIRERMPQVTYSIYEPDPLVFKRFLSSRKLSASLVEALKSIYISGFMANEELESYAFFSELDYRTLPVALPSYERIFAENYNNFCIKFKNSIIDKRFNVGTRYILEKQWMHNAMKNFPYTIKSANILNLSEKVFTGKPAILVASGPSLDEEIENLRKIKQEGLAYIFTAGSAIYKLLKHDIFPDAVCAIDGSDRNTSIFKPLYENPNNNVPLIYADMMYHGVVSNYNAGLFNAPMENNPLEAYYLKYKNDMEVRKVKVVPSVAIVLLQILYNLHCDPIILVGQNLALKDDYYHAAGMAFNCGNSQFKEKITESEKLNAFPVEDVYGNVVYTLKDLDLMRRNMEIMIEYYPMKNIINTTEGGAKIKGTEFMPLSDLMEARLNVPVVNTHWYETESECYDLDYIKHQHELLLKDRESLNDTIKKIEKEIGKIEKAVAQNNGNKLSVLLYNFVEVVKGLTRNRFYKTFIYQTNGLQVELLSKSMESVARETNIVKKGRDAAKLYREFVDDAKSLIKEIEPYFQEFDAKIQGLYE